MKPTKSILILLSLFLMFSCDDNSVEPLVCDEGLTNVDGVCQLCGEGLTEVDGKCNYLCEEGVTECYYQGDLDVLQNIIDVKKQLSLDMKDSKREREIMHELYRESDSKISYLYLKRICSAIFNSIWSINKYKCKMHINAYQRI